MTTLNEVELDPSVMEAFARELARACPGSPGAMLTVYAPEPGGPPWQVEIIPASRPARLPSPAV